MDGRRTLWWTVGKERGDRHISGSRLFYSYLSDPFLGQLYKERRALKISHYLLSQSRALAQNLITNTELRSPCIKWTQNSHSYKKEFKC